MSNIDEYQGLPKLEPHIQEFISSAEGFDKRFLENLRRYLKQEDAYEATERQYEYITGRRKYGSFNSFRVVRNRSARTRSIRKKIDVKPRR